MKKQDDETKKSADKGVDIARPQAGESVAVGGGTGAPPDPGLTPDPNQDMARAAALDTYNAKLAAGEDPGERPIEPVAMSNQTKAIPTGPVAAGMRRVKVLSGATTSAGNHAAGDIVDMSEADAESLGESVEPYGDSAPKAKAKK